MAQPEAATRPPGGTIDLLTAWPHVDFWGSSRFSDCTLELRIDPGATDEQAAVKLVPLHRLALAPASKYFDARLADDVDYCDGVLLAAQPTASQPALASATGAAVATAGAAVAATAAAAPPPVSTHPVAASGAQGSKRSRDADEHAAGQQQGEPPAPASSDAPPPAAKKHRSTAAWHLTEHCTADELPAIMALLKCCYTGKLPRDYQLLAQMCIKAEYWQMDRALRACFDALRQQASADDMPAGLFSLATLLPQRLRTTTVGGKAVMQALLAQVAKRFGSAALLMGDEQLRQQFIRLPFRLLAHWASLDTLATDSENTVAVLLTLWAEHQHQGISGRDAPQLAAQFKELSKLLRVYQCSFSFHAQVIPRLAWYTQPPDLPRDVVLARYNYPRASWGSGPNHQVYGAPRQLLKESTLSWSLSSTQLQGLWEDTATKVWGPTVQWAGYTWQPCVYFIQAAAEGQRTLAVNIKLGFAPELKAALPEDLVPVASATVSITVGSGPTTRNAWGQPQPRQRHTSGVLAWAQPGDVLGWNSVLGRLQSLQQDVITMYASGTPAALSIEIKLSDLH